jgi:putative Holliday junction resolvase
MGRIMALDVGDVRIGVAVSDTMGIIANPLLTYTRTKDEAADISYLTSLAREKDVDLIVSGLPLSLSGTDSIQTGKVRDFVAKVAEHCGLDTKFVDERLTTAAAERVLIEGNVRRENRKKYIDKVAATIILQTYLDYYKR